MRTLRSAVSRGTETLVFGGHVPPSQYAAMRAPFQDGDFPGPVKYGYLNVGLVEGGPARLRGRTVFCLHPHQTAYVVPASAVTVVPDEVPVARAVLAGIVETAVNALWDAPPLVGDRVAVVGAGLLGCCVARLVSRVPGTSVTLVDVDPGRAAVATAWGWTSRRPTTAAGGCDLVLHTSATSAGLQRSLELLAPEGTVLELSWYGDATTTLSLGGSFHSGRLSLRASQVGGWRRPVVIAVRRHNAWRWPSTSSGTTAFDQLLTGESPFRTLPVVMPRLASRELPALCHAVTYDEEDASCSA